MALKSTIIGGVNNAFNLIGDLGEIMTFTNRQTTEYNFGTHIPTTSTGISKTIKGIVSKQYKDISDNPRLLADIILKSSDISSEELDGYDTLIFRSKEWNVNSISDNGFIINVIVAREI